MKFSAEGYEHGFRVVEGHEVTPQLFEDTKSILPKERFLIPNQGNFRFADPLTVEDLFLRFAALAPTEKAICEFANEYGWLGSGVKTRIVLDVTTDNGPFLEGEPIRIWLQDIADMKRATYLWEVAVKDSELNELSKSIERKDEKAVTVSFREPEPDQPFHVPLTASKFFQEIVFTILNKDGEVTPAKLELQKLINVRLSERISPRLSWNVQNGELLLQQVSGNLGGALWMQLAVAIVSQPPPRRCKCCGELLIGRSKAAEFCEAGSLDAKGHKKWCGKRYRSGNC